eukprot:COSAG01_NODE_14473_length_1449_cov_3.077778_1_plen_121_part_00
MTCHILHNPVMTLPIYNCDGCNPAAVEGYCATVGSGHPAVTHDECFRTLSNNSKQCSFGLPLEQSHLVRHPQSPLPTPRPPHHHARHHGQLIPAPSPEPKDRVVGGRFAPSQCSTAGAAG